MIKADFTYTDAKNKSSNRVTDEVEFIPTHKLWMFGNHKPIITDTTHAAWRRLKLIPFNFTVPENDIDFDLPVVADTADHRRLKSQIDQRIDKKIDKVAFIGFVYRFAHVQDTIQGCGGKLFDSCF